jgi:hypothetical protein
MCNFFAWYGVPRVFAHSLALAERCDKTRLSVAGREDNPSVADYNVRARRDPSGAWCPKCVDRADRVKEPKDTLTGGADVRGGLSAAVVG